MQLFSTEINEIPSVKAVQVMTLSSGLAIQISEIFSLFFSPNLPELSDSTHSQFCFLQVSPQDVCYFTMTATQVISS